MENTVLDEFGQVGQGNGENPDQTAQSDLGLRYLPYHC